MIPPQLLSLKKWGEGTSPGREALLTRLAVAESKTEQKKPRVSAQGARARRRGVPHAEVSEQVGAGSCTGQACWQSPVRG